MTVDTLERRQLESKKPSVGDSSRQRVGDRVSIFRLLGSPNWYINYNLDGHQFRKSLRTKSKKRAIELAKQKDAQLVLGVARPPTRQSKSIAEMSARYIKSLELRGRDARTLQVYNRDLEQFAAYAQSRGLIRLQDVDEQLLEDFQERLKTTGMRGIAKQAKRGRRIGSQNSPKTVRNKLKTVRQLIRWAVRRRLLREDPAAGYQLPPEPRHDAFCWSKEEFKRLCDHADPPWLDILQFLATTGLRSDELCWLTIADVNLSERPFVKIRRKACPQTGVCWRPKHGRERIVPLCAPASGICRKVLAESPGPWLFWSENARGKQRGHYRPAVIWRALQKIKAKASIKHGTVHSMRHLFCAFAANSGLSPFKAMAILGHGSLEILLRYYHLPESELLTSLEDVPFDDLVTPRSIGEPT
jgi:site-specific recombinase XerD